ncbi:hypothetical protein [Trinickia violacea]|nr:hypothetical protein [Trinickia violacea]
MRGSDAQFSAGCWQAKGFTSGNAEDAGFLQHFMQIFVASLRALQVRRAP